MAYEVQQTPYMKLAGLIVLCQEVIMYLKSHLSLPQNPSPNGFQCLFNSSAAVIMKMRVSILHAANASASLRIEVCFLNGDVHVQYVCSSKYEKLYQLLLKAMSSDLVPQTLHEHGHHHLTLLQIFKVLKIIQMYHLKHMQKSDHQIRKKLCFYGRFTS